VIVALQQVECVDFQPLKKGTRVSQRDWSTLAIDKKATETSLCRR